MSPLRIWVMAARVRTLPAAVAPVLVGSAAVIYEEGDLPRVGGFIACLAGSILLQIGTNLANDYSDAKRGADSADRLGPVRVTSQGLVTPKRVLAATYLAFGLAVLVGVYLTALAGPVIFAIGAISIAAGVLYTGGPRPYGYAGLGELFVFVFFGLVAVNGSYFVQLEDISFLSAGLSVAVGLLSTAILVVNNVRDIDTDRRAKKRTLAVRLGRDRTRALYLATLVAAAAALVLTVILDGGPALALLGLLATPLALRPLQAVRTRTDGPALNAALAATGALLGVFSLLVAAGLVIAS